MAIKRVRVKINTEEIAKRIEKEVNKEVTIKVPIKGIKVEMGDTDNWSWLLGILIVLALAVMGWRLGQNEKTIRQLIEEKNRLNMTPTIVTPTAEPTPTIFLTPTPTIRLRYRR